MSIRYLAHRAPRIATARMVRRALIMLAVMALALVSATLPGRTSAHEASADPSGNQQGVTELTTQVPATHTVHLLVDTHAQVVVEGAAYTGETDLEIGRLTEQTYRIVAADGRAIDQVTYDDEVVALGSDGTFTAPALNRDGIVLKVTTQVVPPSGELSDTGSDVAQCVGIAAALLMGAAILMIVGATTSRLRWSTVTTHGRIGDDAHRS